MRCFGLLVIFASSLAASDLTITASPQPALVGEEVVFTFSPAVTASGEKVDFNFGDGATATVEFSVDCALFGGCRKISHTYLLPGRFTVSASGTASGQSVTGSLEVTVEATPVASYLYLIAGAHARGAANTNWRTDLVVHNVGDRNVSYRLELLRRDTNNSNPESKDFTLLPQQSRVHEDVFGSVFNYQGAGALRIVANPPTVLGTSRTYNLVAQGTYGQFVPVVQQAQSIPWGKRGRILQLSHNPNLSSGFRTNLGLLNTSPGDITVLLSFYRNDGRFLGEHQQLLKAFEFKQLDKALELVSNQAESGFWVAVEATPQGATFFAYASVVDNLTGDAVFIPAQVFPE